MKFSRAEQGSSTFIIALAEIMVAETYFRKFSKKLPMVNCTPAHTECHLHTYKTQ